MQRIIDANLNRATEALRVLEEIARFHFEDESLSAKLKHIRNTLCFSLDKDYEILLCARDTQNDIGKNIVNENKKAEIKIVFKANVKRLQQALRVLFESTQNQTFEQLRYESYTLEKEMWEKFTMDLNKIRLDNRKLYLVTNSDAFNSDDEFLDAVASALSGGVDIIQLREKTANANRIIALGKKIRELCSIYNALFIVNDRLDLAKILNADGVHIGQEDVDIKTAREFLGKDFIIGVSTHEIAQATEAIENGADYIGVGPVYQTPTKQGREAVGLDYVKYASENVSIPFFAIGGIDENNIDEVLNAGAKRIAVVRAIINSDNPKVSAEKFIAKLS